MKGYYLNLGQKNKSGALHVPATSPVIISNAGVTHNNYLKQNYKFAFGYGESNLKANVIKDYYSKIRHCPIRSFSNSSKKNQLKFPIVKVIEHSISQNISTSDNHIFSLLSFITLIAAIIITIYAIVNIELSAYFFPIGVAWLFLALLIDIIAGILALIALVRHEKLRMLYYTVLIVNAILLLLALTYRYF